jgi:hypothetical protein
MPSTVITKGRRVPAPDLDQRLRLAEDVRAKRAAATEARRTGKASRAREGPTRAAQGRPQPPPAGAKAGAREGRSSRGSRAGSRARQRRFRRGNRRCRCKRHRRRPLRRGGDARRRRAGGRTRLPGVGRPERSAAATTGARAPWWARGVAVIEWAGAASLQPANGAPQHEAGQEQAPALLPVRASRAGASPGRLATRRGRIPVTVPPDAARSCKEIAHDEHTTNARSQDCRRSSLSRGPRRGRRRRLCTVHGLVLRGWRALLSPGLALLPGSRGRPAVTQDEKRGPRRLERHPGQEADQDQRDGNDDREPGARFDVMLETPCAALTRRAVIPGSASKRGRGPRSWQLIRTR